MSRSEDIALLIARLFVSAMFLPGGVDKLMNFAKYTGSLAAKGLPYPNGWAVMGVGVEVMGPILLMVGAWSRWTAVALLLWTAVMTWVTYRSELFGLLLRQPQHPQLSKTIAVTAGLLFYLVSGPGNYSWRPRVERY